MPDDAVTPAAVTPAESVKPAEPVQSEVTETKPHPLEPGGERFSQVYADMQAARRDAARMQGELDALKAQQRQTQQTKQPVHYTPQQLQGMVDSGQITAALMSDQLAWQRAQEARGQAKAEYEFQQRSQAALGEVNQFIEKIPALNDISSPEFGKVRKAAYDIAAELNLEVSDPRVQRRALRETFGTLDRVQAASGAVDHARQRRDTFADTGGGGGAPDGSKPDPLKAVPKAYREHWERLKYTPEQMAAEAKYISREPRKGEGAR